MRGEKLNEKNVEFSSPSGAFYFSILSPAPRCFCGVQLKVAAQNRKSGFLSYIDMH